MYKKFAKFSFFAILAIFAIGCSDENALSAVEDKIDDEVAHQEWKMSYDRSSAEEAACFYGTSTHTDSWCCKNYDYQCYKSSSSTSEANACYYGTSTHSDYWCCTNYGYQCNSYSSSSSYYYYYSSSSASYYTETAKTLKFTLTYYEQRVKFDESSLTDGDPEISFKLKFVNITGDTTTKNTGLLLDLSNQGYWSGTKSITFAVPANTEKIYVCPKVIDEDVLYDDNKSAGCPESSSSCWGYCYIRSNIGYLSNYTTVDQSDYKNDNLYLEWEWYLY